MTVSRPRRRVGPALAALLGIVATSCTSGPPGPLAYVDDDVAAEPSVIRVATWDAAPLAEGIEAWEREHPTARVVIDVRPIDEHHAQALGGYLDADVVAIDASRAEDTRNRTDLFTNLLLDGGTVIGGAADTGLSWRIAQGTANDGTRTSAAVDVGGFALAVRRDLLGAVPARRGSGTLFDSVTQAQTWCELIRAGDQWSDATGTAFFPSAASIFDAVLTQQETAFVDDDGIRVHETSAGVQRAWETAMLAMSVEPSQRLFENPCPRLRTAGSGDAGIGRITAARSPLTGRWEDGLRNGSFIALVVDSTTIDVLRRVAPQTAGAWELIPIPGVVGSRAGTSLAVSARSANIPLAKDLVRSLTTNRVQVNGFAELGRFPASTEVHDLESVTDVRLPFFGDSAIAELFTNSTVGWEPAPEGPHGELLREQFRAAVGRVDAGTQNPQEAWTEAMWRIELILEE